MNQHNLVVLRRYEGEENALVCRSMERAAELFISGSSEIQELDSSELNGAERLKSDGEPDDIAESSSFKLPEASRAA